MEKNDLGLFLDSFDRCFEKPAFLDHFYAHFLASSPEIAEKFAGTDFSKQKKALKTSLFHMMAAVAQKGEKDGTLTVLRDVAHRHSRGGLDIRPELYEQWLDSLVHAVSRCDERFGEDVARVWRAAMRPGIRYILAYY